MAILLKAIPKKSIKHIKISQDDEGCSIQQLSDYT